MRSYTLCTNRFKFITDPEPLFLAHPVHTNDTETANYAAYLCTHSPTPMLHVFLCLDSRWNVSKSHVCWEKAYQEMAAIGALEDIHREFEHCWLAHWKHLTQPSNQGPQPCTFITDTLRLDFDAKWSTNRSRKWSQYNTKPVFPWVFFDLLAGKWCPGAESNHRHEDFQ